MTSADDIALNPNELKEFYANYFSYYNTLNDTYKDLFITRALQFISEKTITGADGFSPDNRVKALISASAIQLTLGMETWQLGYFEEIVIHASDFENANGDVKFSGETNLQGYIKLSWKNFIRGYKISDDNLNLGLHEFSHALRFNGLRGEEQDYFMDHYFNKWMCCASQAFSDLNTGRPTIFRKYGGTNSHEFLSVCIEHYFESPQEIKDHYPILYYATAAMLNQEPGMHTRIGVRREALRAQNACLPGFQTQRIQSHFLRHWTSRLSLFLSAMLIYAASINGILHPITLGILILLAGTYVLYDYNALTVDLEGLTAQFKKGAFLFKQRRIWNVPVSHLISVRKQDKEWAFVYYDETELFFYEESVHPPERVTESVISECKANKIAVLS